MRVSWLILATRVCSCESNHGRVVEVAVDGGVRMCACVCILMVNAQGQI